MTVISPAIGGVTARPYTGTPHCGYMRPIGHHCKDLTCPLNSSYVMAFADSVPAAITACRRLWDTEGRVIIAQRFTVLAETLTVSSEPLEEGVLKGDPADWSNFRGLVSEHERPVVHLSTIGALVSQAGTPAEMWVPRGPQMRIPQDAEIGRTTHEHPSWPPDLEPPWYLIGDLEDDEPEAEVDPADGL